MAVGHLGLQNTRRAGAQDPAHAPPAPALRGALHGVEEAVLMQSQLGQPIVSALELEQFLRQARFIDARHFADVGIDVHGLESADRQAAAPFEQCAKRCRRAFADAAGRRIGLEQQGLHRGIDERKVTQRRCFSSKASSSRGNTSRMTGLPPRLRAALPSCSSSMSPPRSGLANRRYTASEFARTVSKPRRVQLASRNCSRVSMGSRKGLRSPAGARKNCGVLPVTLEMLSCACEISALMAEGPMREKLCRCRWL